MTATTTKNKYFIADQFTATAYDAPDRNTRQEKADAANQLAEFLLQGCPKNLFTKKLYYALSQHLWGHIAHYNLDGFYEEWFSSADRRVDFILRATTRIPCGDPKFTYSDVETLFARWLNNVHLPAWYVRKARGQHTTDTTEQARIALLNLPKELRKQICDEVLAAE